MYQRNQGYKWHYFGAKSIHIDFTLFKRIDLNPNICFCVEIGQFLDENFSKLRNKRRSWLLVPKCYRRWNNRESIDRDDSFSSKRWHFPQKTAPESVEWNEIVVIFHITISSSLTYLNNVECWYASYKSVTVMKPFFKKLPNRTKIYPHNENFIN